MTELHRITSDYPERKVNFVRKNGLFEAIDNYLNNTKSLLLINELSGSGKSTQACEYGYQKAMNHGYIVRWFNADSYYKLSSRYICFALELGLDVVGKDGQASLNTALIDKVIKKIVETDRDYLFIFDNLDSEEMLLKLVSSITMILPPKVRVLGTTKNFHPEIFELFSDISQLDIFTQPEAESYIVKELGFRLGNNSSYTPKILKHVGFMEYIPVKLNKVISIIKFFEFKPIERVLSEDILEDFDIILIQLFQYLFEKDYDAKYILITLAFLDKDIIPIDFLSKILGISAARIQNSLVSLKNIKLINSTDDYLNIHSDIHNELKLFLKFKFDFYKDEFYNIYSDLISRLRDAFCSKDDMTRLSRPRYYFHAIKILEFFDNYGKKATGDMINEQAIYQELADFFEKQFQHHDLRLKFLHKKFQSAQATQFMDSSVITEILYTLSMTHLSAKEYQESIKYLQSVLSIHLRELGQDSPKVASTFYQLGDIHRKATQYDQSVENYSYALDIYARNKEKQEIIIETLNTIGDTYTEAGNHDKAIENYQDVLNIHIVANKEKDPSIANSLCRIAVAHRNKKDYVTSNKILNDALELYRLVYDDVKNYNHMNIVKTLECIGMNLHDMKDYRNAYETYREALTLMKDDNEYFPNVLKKFVITMSKLGDDDIEDHQRAMQKF